MNVTRLRFTETRLEVTFREEEDEANHIHGDVDRSALAEQEFFPRSDVFWARLHKVGRVELVNLHCYPLVPVPCCSSSCCTTSIAPSSNGNEGRGRNSSSSTDVGCCGLFSSCFGAGAGGSEGTIGESRRRAASSSSPSRTVSLLLGQDESSNPNPAPAQQLDPFFPSGFKRQAEVVSMKILEDAVIEGMTALTSRLPTWDNKNGPDGAASTVAATSDEDFSTRSARIVEAINAWALSRSPSTSPLVTSTSSTTSNSKRHFLVFLNPNSGPGYAEKIWRRRVQPALDSHPNASYELVKTKYSGHAREVVREAFAGGAAGGRSVSSPSSSSSTCSYAGILILSGDGLVHEVYRGLHDADAVDRVPLAHVPAGSGNALVSTLLAHSREPLSTLSAVLLPLKGGERNLDLWHTELTDGGSGQSQDQEHGHPGGEVGPHAAATTGENVVVVQIEDHPSSPLSPDPSRGDKERAERRAVQMNEKKIRPMFLSLALGLMADLDIESEWLRCLGGFRFTVYAVRNLARYRVYEADVHYQGIEVLPANIKHNKADPLSSIVVHLNPTEDEPEQCWRSIADTRFVSLWAFSLPLCSTKECPAPTAKCDDGYLWVLLCSATIGRCKLAQVLLSLESGTLLQCVNGTTVRLIRCTGLRVEKTAARGGAPIRFIDVDGERVDVQDPANFKVQISKMPKSGRVFCGGQQDRSSALQLV